MVEAGCAVRGFTMEVYNRWGQLVYSGTDFSAGWDGNWNGEPAEVGAYFYTVRMEAGTEHHLFYKTGDVTLVR
jgi:gliding motility-associated-like protein